MEKQFLKECKETRDAFVKVAGTYNISNNLELRTEIDSLLIMYDQLCERVRLANAKTEIRQLTIPVVVKEERIGTSVFCPECGGELLYVDHDKCTTEGCPNCIF